MSCATISTRTLNLESATSIVDRVQATSFPHQTVQEIVEAVNAQVLNQIDDGAVVATRGHQDCSRDCAAAQWYGLLCLFCVCTRYICNVYTCATVRQDLLHPYMWLTRSDWDRLNGVTFMPMAVGIFVERLKA